MALAYDDVIPKLIETCESHPEFEAVQPVLVVQTVLGRVRLVLSKPNEAQRDAVTRAVEGALGAWFEGPILSPSMAASPGLRRLAQHLWEEVEGRQKQVASWTDRWPAGWPSVFGPVGQPVIALEGRWEALQVAVGKDPWLRVAPAVAPWPMDHGAPRITAFYGFKGGVGRTTTLAVLAWQLAQMGQRVVCVDLDLESPGLGPALVADPDALTTPGVIDVLLSHAVTGSILSGPLATEVPLHGAQGLYLVHAGRITSNYVEKLARLDLAHHEGGPSRVHAALKALLKALRREVKPHHIFLDCRSGLHDLAGLALHDLAHVDVLVGRGDAQEMQGLKVLVPQILRRRAEPDERLLFLRTFHPAPNQRELHAQQRQALHDLLAADLYRGEPPDVDELEKPHDPVPIVVNAQFSRVPWMGELERSVLGGESFTTALERLHMLWANEGTS